MLVNGLRMGAGKRDFLHALHISNSWRSACANCRQVEDVLPPMRRNMHIVHFFTFSRRIYFLYLTVEHGKRMGTGKRGNFHGLCIFIFPEKHIYQLPAGGRYCSARANEYVHRAFFHVFP